MDLSTMTRSQVSSCGKLSKEDLYFISLSQSDAATFVGTSSRAVVVAEASEADLAARYRT